MEITNVKIRKATKGSNIKAYADITIGDNFCVHNLKIIECQTATQKTKTFVAMPSFRVENEYKDICHPINKEFRDELSTAVLSEYKKVILDV